jgi:phosphate/sulfate permease
MGDSSATSVGSKSLSQVQALVIAGILQFTGAVTLGAAVTDTARGGIVPARDFKTTADVLIVGMLCALISVSLWLAIATAFSSLPVSTTHSVVSAVLGFRLRVPWADNIKWDKLVEIVISRFLSPAPR